MAEEKTNGVDADAEIIEFAVRTLRGDLRDAMLDLVRTLPSQWHQLSEEDQRKAAYRIDEAVREYLTKAAAAIAGEGRITITATLGKVAIGDKGIEGKVILPRWDQRRHLFNDAQGSDVEIVLSDVTKFMGERAPAKIDPEQPPLPLETLEVEPGGDELPTNDEADNDPLGLKGGAWEMGRQARMHNTPRERNLFEAGSEEFTAWRKGWDEQDEEIDGRADTEQQLNTEERSGPPRKRGGRKGSDESQPLPPD